MNALARLRIRLKIFFHERMYLGRLIVGVVIQKDGKYFLIEENRGGKMFLNIPAGHLEPKESPVEGAIREAKEESGFEVRLRGLRCMLCSTWDSGLSSVYWIFDAEIIGGDMQPEKGVKAGWFTLDEWEARMKIVEPMPAIPSIFEAVKNNQHIDSKAMYFMDRRGKEVERQTL